MALLYASKYSETVSGVVLLGYWGMNMDHLSWDYIGFLGKRTFYPKEWQKICENVGCADFKASNGKYSDLLMKWNKKLTGPEGDESCLNYPSSEPCTALLSNACSFLRYDAAGSSVKAIPNDPCQWSPNSNPSWYQLHPVEAARIGIHLYLKNIENSLPDLTSLVANKVSVNFIHGRYDMLCPPAFGYEMVKLSVQKGADLGKWKTTIVENVSHSACDPGMKETIQEALWDIAFEQE